MPNTPQPSPQTCSVAGCCAPFKARGWCDKHYRRWREHGDPLTVHRAPPMVDRAKHGRSTDSEYRVLNAARQRCVQPRRRDYSRYGGRGIEFRLPDNLGEATRRLIESIGPRPDGMSLDRINNDGHYEIGNLRWATKSEQGRNRRPRAIASAALEAEAAAS